MKNSLFSAKCRPFVATFWRHQSSLFLAVESSFCRPVVVSRGGRVEKINFGQGQDSIL